MTPRSLRRSAALFAGAVLATVPVATVAVAVEPYGPSDPYTTILNGQYPFIPLPNAAMISPSQYGYIYRAGQQDSRLVITQVPDGLRFHDSGTQTWKSLPDSCRRQNVPEGVAAVCTVPAYVGADDHLLLEVWPRLGDDHVDASSLPAFFDVTVLADAGADVVKLGAGNDFVNGAFDDDWVSAGAGNDWIRTGDGRDELWGEAGNDKLVGAPNSDVLRGGEGNDVVYGGTGGDTLSGDAGKDLVSCGGGPDVAFVDGSEQPRYCESVTRN